MAPRKPEATEDQIEALQKEMVTLPVLQTMMDQLIQKLDQSAEERWNKKIHTAEEQRSSAERFVEVPIFTGDNLEHWISWTERYFSDESFSDFEKMQFAYGFVEEDALVWFDGETSRSPFKGWDDFRIRVFHRFGKDKNQAEGDMKSMDESNVITVEEEEQVESAMRSLKYLRQEEQIESAKMVADTFKDKEARHVFDKMALRKNRVKRKKKRWKQLTKKSSPPYGRSRGFLRGRVMVKQRARRWSCDMLKHFAVKDNKKTIAKIKMHNCQVWLLRFRTKKKRKSKMKITCAESCKYIYKIRKLNRKKLLQILKNKFRGQATRGSHRLICFRHMRNMIDKVADRKWLLRLSKKKIKPKMQKKRSNKLFSEGHNNQVHIVSLLIGVETTSNEVHKFRHKHKKKKGKRGNKWLNVAGGRRIAAEELRLNVTGGKMSISLVVLILQVAVVHALNIKRMVVCCLISINVKLILFACGLWDIILHRGHREHSALQGFSGIMSSTTKLHMDILMLQLLKSEEKEATASVFGRQGVG